MAGRVLGFSIRTVDRTDSTRYSEHPMQLFRICNEVRARSPQVAQAAQASIIPGVEIV
jgi:hypothetical protein